MWLGAFIIRKKQNARRIKPPRKNLATQLLCYVAIGTKYWIVGKGGFKRYKIQAIKETNIK